MGKKRCHFNHIQSVVDLIFDRQSKLFMSDSFWIPCYRYDSDSIEILYLEIRNYSHFIAAFDLSGDHLFAKRFLGSNNLH